MTGTCGHGAVLQTWAGLAPKPRWPEGVGGWPGRHPQLSQPQWGGHGCGPPQGEVLGVGKLEQRSPVSSSKVALFSARPPSSWAPARHSVLLLREPDLVMTQLPAG